LGVQVPSRDSLIDDVQLQNSQLADLCKQAEALRHAARLLCDYLTERIQHTRALLQFQGSSDRRKKPRVNIACFDARASQSSVQD
jgi:hypothetical protein